MYCDPFTSEELPLDGDFEGNEVIKFSFIVLFGLSSNKWGFDSNFSLLC